MSSHDAEESGPAGMSDPDQTYLPDGVADPREDLPADSGDPNKTYVSGRSRARRADDDAERTRAAPPAPTSEQEFDDPDQTYAPGGLNRTSAVRAGRRDPNRTQAEYDDPEQTYADPRDFGCAADGTWTESEDDGEMTFMPGQSGAPVDLPQTAATVIEEPEDDGELTFMPGRSSAPVDLPQAAATVLEEPEDDAEMTFMPGRSDAPTDLPAGEPGVGFRQAETFVDEAEMTFMPSQGSSAPAAEDAIPTVQEAGPPSAHETVLEPGAAVPPIDDVAAEEETKAPKTRRPATRRPATRRPHTRAPQTRAAQTGSPKSMGDGLESVNRSKALRTTRMQGTDPDSQLFAGKYRLLGEIARGGMGVVYRALQVDLNQKVALKVMLAGSYASKSAQRRFLFEAEASARLKHKNIVPVFDIGSEGEKLYFTMALVSGEELKDRRSTLDRSQLLEVMIQVCDGVDYAHKRGIIHRDLKPGNVMMDEENTPLIMDFGLAKQLGDASDGDDELEASDAPMTVDGSIMGTPHFMSPEQARGKIADIDTRSDVYALGVMLYQLWTGEYPYQGKGHEILAKILSEDPPAPREIDPTIDMDLEAVTLKAMEKDVEKRYESAGDLKRDLEQIRDGLPVSARRATVLYRAGKWAKRNRGRLQLAGAFALLIGLGIGAVIQQRVAAERRQEEQVQASLSSAEAALEAVRSESRSATQDLEALLAQERSIPDRRAKLPALLARLRGPGGLEARLEQAERQVSGYAETHPRARALGAELETERAQVAQQARRLLVLKQVHGELDRARAWLEKAKAQRAVALSALSAAVQSGAPPTWTDLPAAIASCGAFLRAARDGASPAPNDATVIRASRELDRRLGLVNQSLFTAIRLSSADAPEVTAAKGHLAQGGALRNEVDAALARAAETRLAKRLLAFASALSEHLAEQPPTGDDAVRRRRLRGAGLAQALVQRALEADRTVPGLGQARQTANLAHAKALLGLKAYKVFDAQLADRDAFTPEARGRLIALRQTVLEETHKLRKKLEGGGLRIDVLTGKIKVRGAGRTSGRTLLTLKLRLGQLKRLARHPYMDDELERLRQATLAKVEKTVKLAALKYGREKLEGGVQAALAAEKAVPAGKRLAALEELLAAWTKAEKMLGRRYARGLSEEVREAHRRACVMGRARLQHDAALAVAQTDPDRARRLIGEAAKLYRSLPPEAFTQELRARLESDLSRLNPAD